MTTISEDVLRSAEVNVHLDNEIITFESIDEFDRARAIANAERTKTLDPAQHAAWSRQQFRNAVEGLASICRHSAVGIADALERLDGDNFEAEGLIEVAGHLQTAIIEQTNAITRYALAWTLNVGRLESGAE